MPGMGGHHHHGIMEPHVPGWNPNALCDGKFAHERALWLVENERLAPMTAQQRVMMEFPAMFGGMGMPVPPMAVPMAPMAVPIQPVMPPATQPCFHCEGKGFSHDSTMPHDK